MFQKETPRQEVTLRPPRGVAKPRPKSVGSKNNSSLSVPSSSPSVVQRLDSLVISPRSKDSLTAGKQTVPDGTPKPAPRSFNASSAVDLSSCHNSPLSSNKHYAGVDSSPRVPPAGRREFTGHSPARHDVPPDVGAYNTVASNRTPRDSADDADKATQWYEYGCV